MALSKCPDCGRGVSTSATACPGCGRPTKAPQPAHVQTTQGATGKFLDPAANARSCLGCVAAVVIGAIALMLLGLANGILR